MSKPRKVLKVSDLPPRPAGARPFSPMHGEHLLHFANPGSPLPPMPLKVSGLVGRPVDPPEALKTDDDSLLP
jgi:hypothetical protein